MQMKSRNLDFCLQDRIRRKIIMRAYERLLHYVSFGTQSDHTSETVPSTASQKVLAADLVEDVYKRQDPGFARGDGASAD